MLPGLVREVRLIRGYGEAYSSQEHSEGHTADCSQHDVSSTTPALEPDGKPTPRPRVLDLFVYLGEPHAKILKLYLLFVISDDGRVLTIQDVLVE